MTMPAPPAAHGLRLTGYGFPACYQPCLSTAVDTDGHVPITGPATRRDVLQRLGFHRAALMAQCQRWGSSRGSQASACRAALQAVVIEILKMGKA